MKSKTKFALWVLPLLALSLTLAWAKWKNEHPTPTASDLRLRQQLLKAEKVVIINKNSHFTRLSTQERREIVKNINIIWNGPAPTMVFHKRGGQYIQEDDITIWWGKAKGTHMVNAIDIGSTERMDYYRHSDDVGQFLPLHPATSRFLRQWLNRHPDILNAND